MADVNANINIDINSSDAVASLKRLEGQINAFQRSIAGGNAAAAAQQAAVNRALLDGINATGLFTAKQISAIDSAARFTNALEKNKLTLGEYTRYASSQLPGLSRVFRREFETMERVATDRVKAINTQYIAMGRTVDGVTKAIKSTPTGLAKGYATEVAIAAQRQQMFNKLIDDGSTKLLNWGKNTQWAGRQLMVGLSLPLAAFGAAAAAAFMELDKATIQLRRVYGDLSTTTAEVDANAEAIKRLGAEYTKYGIAVADTIQLGARAAATGATNETLFAATEQTLRFATLGQIDYNQALDTTISLQTAFGVSNEDLASKIDFLNAVENQTILTIEDMSLAIPRVATVVKGLGGDVEDLAVMMTAMREGGVSAENAANGLKSGLASMINPTNKAKEMLKGFNINLEGIVKQYEGDLLGTIIAFGQELDKLSDIDRQRALEKVFGKYQYARMSALFDNMISKSGQAARAMDLASYSMQDLATIAEKELGTISESTTVKFQASLEQLKLAIAPLGEAFLKVATPAIEMITKIANAFNELPESIKNAIGVATIAIAGIGPVLLMGIGLMGNLVANIIKGIQWWRKLGARIRGNAADFDYMTKAELDALAATEALEGSSTSLTSSLGLQARAVSVLSREYGRFITVAGGAAGAMGAFPAAGGGGRGKAPIKRARGGIVPGSGNGDIVPALLEPGETVITKEASQRFGPVLAAMNAGTLPGYQGGLNLPGVRVPDALSFAQGKRTTQAMEGFFESIKDLDGAAEKASEILKGFADRGEKITNSNFMKAMSAAGYGPRRSLPSGSFEAAHLTKFNEGRLSAQGRAMLQSMPGKGGIGQSVTAQRLLTALQEQPALEKFIREYSGLTANLPKEMNKSLLAVVGSGRGVQSSEFLKEFDKGGKTLGASLEKFGGFVASTAEETEALATFERELGERVKARADEINNGLVVDSILTEETEKLIREKRRAGGALGKVAVAAEKAQKAVAQVALDLSSAEGRAFIEQNPDMFIQEKTTGKDGKERTNVYYAETGPDGKKTKGAYVARYSEEGGRQRWRPSERVGRLARGAGGTLGKQSVAGARAAVGAASPAEEFAEVMDDAAEGMLVGAKRSNKTAAKSGEMLAQSAQAAYKAEMSQLRRDIRNDDLLVEAGITDPTKRTRALRKAKRAQERPSQVQAGIERKQKAQMDAAERQAQKEAERQAKADAKAAADKRERSARRRQRISRGVGRVGGGIGALSLVPFMAQDQQGQFMGMDANMLGMGMMAAPMIMPAMKGVAAGATALAGAMGVSVAAVAAPAAALAAVAVTAYALKKGLDNTIEAGRQFSDAMTTSAEEQKQLADLFGTQTYAEKRRAKQVEKLTGLTTEQQQQGKEFVGTEQGQAMVAEARTLLERGGGDMFSRNLATQLSQQVLSGAIDVSQAKAIATGISEELGRADLVAPITGEINRILAPNGNEVGAKPMQIQASIQANLEQDEAELERQMQNLTKTAEGAFMGGTDSVAKLWSGDWDAATAASVAYYNTLVSNSASMYSTYLDQRGVLRDQIADLKEQIKQEDDKAKKIELQNQLLAAQNQLRGIDLQGENLAARKQAEMNALRGSAEAQHSARLAIEEMGVADTGALMHQMAMARERELGRAMTTAEREEFEISFMVDLQTRRIDPVALQTLQTANERLHGDAENIIDTVVDFQAKGDFETANQILQLTSMMPDEVLTVFNTQIEGMSDDQIMAYADVMSMIPANVATTIGVELAGMSPEDLKTFKDDLTALQGLGIDTGELISSGGVEAITEAADGLKSIEDQLSSKKIQKGLKEINNLELSDTKTRAKKVIEITTELQDAEGNPISEKDAKNAVQDVLNKTGMTEEGFYALPADVSTKVIAAQVNANAYKELAMAATKARNAAKDDPVEYAKQEKLRAMYYSIYEAYSNAAATGASSGGASMGLGGGDGGADVPTVKDDAKGAGSGSAKSDPYKDFRQGIVDQIKRFADMEINMKKLMDKKYNFFNLLKMSNGIDDKIRKAGITGALADELMSMDPDEANKIINRMTGKGGKLTAEGRRLQDQYMAGQIMKTDYEQQQSIDASRAQSRAMQNARNIRLYKRDGSAGRQLSAAGVAALSQNAEIAKQYNFLIDKAIDAQERMRKATGKNKQAAIDTWNNAAGALDRYMKKIEKAALLQEGMNALLDLQIQRRRAEETAGMVKEAKSVPGISQELIDEIASGNYTAAYQGAKANRDDLRERLRKDPTNKSLKRQLAAAEEEYKNFFTNLQNDANQAKINMAIANPAQALSEGWDDLMSFVDASFEEMKVGLERISDINFEAAYGKSKEDAEKLIKANDALIAKGEEQINIYQRLNNDEQRLIEGHEREKKQWQDKIDTAQDYIDDWQHSIELLNKQVSERNHQANLLNHELDLMSKAEEQINETYDKRMEALDQVEAVNNRILESQRSQLDISRALSTGDVYAAAEAAQQMREQQTQQAMTDARDALTIARDNQVNDLRSSSGMTRDQIEEQLWQINQQNYQTSLQVYDLEDKIWKKNQEIYGLKQEIEKIDDLIKEHTDKIWQNNGKILEINSNLDPIRSQNALWTDRLNTSARNLESEVASLEVLGQSQAEWDNMNKVARSFYNRLAAQQKVSQNMLDTWKEIAKAISVAQDEARGDTNALANAKWKDIKTIELEDFTDDEGVVDVSGARKEIISRLGQKIAELLGTSQDMGKFFEVEKKYAGGFVSGMGSRDSVPTMLTPGEFIVRKSMVKKYGASMFDKINQGAFDLPTYKVSQSQPTIKPMNVSSVTAPVYNNTYSINVPVNQPNASADEIAYKVMTKIKSIDSATIRRVNGY